ncbi:hypothetical protein PG999_007719 [Apiospora kogelbergensis]|uniref:Uncharacterized protein n=1 Tax=Apiospora kogelbergensis TaxID=1337665 RepID=A0AAW0QLU1_9PEZI
MDGTYGNIYPNRTASPMTPGTPTAYQTNINRTKTRKWVEAKVQNYDGDDWGDDYDDEEEPEEQPPPTKPTGLRQPGQGAAESTTVTSPYGQAPVPHAVGPRAMPMPSHVRKTSTGLRTPSGAPPLQVQTQQHQSNVPNEQGYGSGSGDTSGLPSSVASAPNRFVADQPSPQQPTAARQNPSAATYSGRPEQTGPLMSPSAQTRGRASSSTQAAPNPSSARFPPRKSSMSRQDMPDPADISRPRSGSRPDSSSGSARPWMEQRTNSPGQTTNASKPLPFVRPADIYRRMEEEKSRSSLDSSRPSMDSNDGGAMRSPERRRPSFDRDDPASDTSRGLKTTLAPVAERRSEYGLDRLLANSNADTAEASRAQQPIEGAKNNYISDEQSRLNKLELQGSRRLSVSPQLPNLSRMSGFGDDFFSGGSTPGTTSEAQPQYFLEDPNPIAGSHGASNAPTAASDLPHRAPSLLEGPALGTSLTSKDSAGQPASAAPAEANTVTPNQKASETSRPSRPSIPGGWVTETTMAGSETPTPMENSGLPTRQLSPPQEETSPVTQFGTEDLVPTTAVKQAQPLDTTPKMAPQNDGFGGATGKHDQNVANEVAPTGPASHAAPLSLPPLQIGNSEDMPHLQRETTSNSTSTGAQPEPSPSQFVPTAPLNPRRVETSDGEFVARMPPRNLTMSSIETSSPDETDRLRDDIMKSLNASPVPTGGMLGPSSGSLEGAGLTRESTYLSDVYDDYLGPAEDKSLQETGRAIRDAGKDNPPLFQGPSQTDPEPSSISATTPSAQAPPKIAEAPTFKRRFSWEGGGPEEVSTSPTTDTNTPFFGADTSQDPVKTSTSSPSVPTTTVDSSAAPTPAVHINPDNDGTMSHQVSMVSSRGPEGLGVAGLEPPSPVSILSNRKSLASAGIDHSKRLSLADEKSLMEETSQPPSPPHAQHPALSPSTEQMTMADPAPSEPAPAPTSSLHPQILTWREILSLPTLPMRSEAFEKARVQYSEMDSGLGNWLQHMQGQAEGGNAAGSETNLPLAGASGPMQSPTSAGGQEPYYQQYLNASNPSLSTAPQPGIVRQGTGNLLQGQQPSSGFGAPNQIGAKSKELLHSAAGFGNKATKQGFKSGMKLFNKGKSKFRGAGTGDKVYQ